MRFYEAARNAGLGTDNPSAGVKSLRVRQATGAEKLRLRNLPVVTLMAIRGC